MVDLDTSIPATASKTSQEPTVRQGQHAKIFAPFNGGQSSLKMRWLVIDDPRMPLKFEWVCGVIPSVDAERMIDAGGGFFLCYKAEIAVMPTSDLLAAYEVRFMLFDLWGEHSATLSATMVRDCQSGRLQKEQSRWPLWSESEGWKHFASIGYVARAITIGGQLFSADNAFILREAKRFSETITEADLEPKSPKKDS